MRARILIADEDEIARDAMSQVLADRGHDVTAAADGARALSCLRREPFDVAILAQDLPFLDGTSTARRLVLAGRSAAAPLFIGVTADPASLDVGGRDGSVFHDVVQKPLNLAAFVFAVEECLATRRHMAADNTVMDTWRRGGFGRRPRARFVAEPGRDWTTRLARVFDLTHPANPDMVLLTEGLRVDELVELRTAGNLFTVPMVDVAGRWGGLADATFDVDDGDRWDEAGAVAIGFAARRAQLTSRFLSRPSLAEKLLAYVFVSGRDLAPLDIEADEWTPVYPGFFPTRRVQGLAEMLVHLGLLTQDRSPASTTSPYPAFRLTSAAVDCLTGIPDPARQRKRR